MNEKRSTLRRRIRRRDPVANIIAKLNELTFRIISTDAQRAVYLSQKSALERELNRLTGKGAPDERS